MGYSGMCVTDDRVCCYTRKAIMADDDEEVIKVCLNPDCTGKNPVKGGWCTARACKEMRAMATKAKAQAKLAKACAAVGAPVPAAQPMDDGQCYELHSVHGVLDCELPKLSGKQLEKAPLDDPKQLCFLVFGTFAATVDDYENDRHCKDMLKVVKYKDLWNSLGSDDKSTLHRYAREKSDRQPSLESQARARG